MTAPSTIDGSDTVADPSDGGPTTTAPRTEPVMARVPVVLQQASAECGAACLGMVLALHGRWVPLDQLREDCGVDRNGASLKAIVRAASEHGLAHEAHFGDVDSLDGLAVPAIIWWERNHFVVLEGASKGRFHIADPARGHCTVDRAEFEAAYSGVAVILRATDALVPLGGPYRTSRSLARRLAHSRAGVAFAAIAGVVAMLLGILVGPLNEVFIDDVLGLDRRDLLPALIGVTLAIGLFQGGLTLLQFGVLARLQAKFTLVGTVDVLNRLVRLPVLFYLARSPGDLSQRVTYSATVAQLLAGQVASSAIALLAVAGYAVLVLYYSWLIGLVVLALAAVNAVVLRALQRRRTDEQHRLLKQQNRIYGTTTESIRDIETLKASGREDDVLAELVGQQTSLVNSSASLTPSCAVLAALPPTLGALTAASVLVLGGYLTIQGSFSVGQLLAVQALALGLNAPIRTLMATGSQLQIITSNLVALDDVLSNDVDPRFDRPPLTDADAPVEVSGHLQFVDVTFAYGRNAEPVVRHFDLEVRPGRHVALVGVSGSGKSTLGNLAAGLFEPQHGQVLYDGRPLADHPIPVVERSVAKVDQRIVLFQGTVSDNVTLWDPTIPESDVVAALADAQVLDDVLARQGSLDAVVEEDGRNFSGGQAQRIEIARALVRNPRLIILDEATSALDDVTEKLVDDAIRRRGMAALIVAHRLSTIRDADEIIVLGVGGAVLERGTHDDLMRRAGAYARMVADADEGGDVGS